MAAATIRSEFGAQEIIVSSLYCCLIHLWRTHTAYLFFLDSFTIEELQKV